MEFLTGDYDRQETGLEPHQEGEWIFTAIDFMRQGHADAVKRTYKGSRPFSLAMDNNAEQCIAILDTPLLDDIYEAPEGFQNDKILAWIKDDQYRGIAFENTSQSARIICCGVSIEAAKLGWGQNWR